MYMGTKTISVMDDAYELLGKNKRKGESFSEEIRRVFKAKNDFLSFAGAWKEISKTEESRIKKAVGDFGKRLDSGFLSRVKRLDLP